MPFSGSAAERSPETGVRFFLNETGGERLPSACIFMSGSGTNAERLLESLQSPNPKWSASLIFTDCPLTSRAYEIEKKFNVPTASLDIKEFYRSRGESRVSLATESGRKIREAWTEQARGMIRPFGIDFGILAGFVPLTNIMGDFPCLNVHPGDLTVEEDGRRILAGLHTVPIETAILRGMKTQRASVILAQPYTGLGGEMDSGPILGISQALPLDLMGSNLDLLAEIKKSRPALKPRGGYGDELEKIAKANQEYLKVHGDWIIFPQLVRDFAAGLFALDDKGGLLFRNAPGESWIPVKTVEFAPGNRCPIHSAKIRGI